MFTEIRGNLEISEDILTNTPSRRVGISEEVEMKHRLFCSNLIKEGGMLLKLPQVVIVTSQILAHRFLYRKSLKEYSAFQIAMTTTFLGSKIEEEIRSVNSVINVFMRIFQRYKNIKCVIPSSCLERVEKWKSIILKTELDILSELGFLLYSLNEHPHKYILYYISELGGNKELAQISWNFLNDCFHSDICVKYSGECLACSAILLGSRKLKIKLPDNPPWWKLFHNDGKIINEICNRIMELYQYPKIDWLDSLFEDSIENSEITKNELLSEEEKEEEEYEKVISSINDKIENNENNRKSISSSSSSSSTSSSSSSSTSSQSYRRNKHHHKRYSRSRSRSGSRRRKHRYNRHSHH